MYKYFILLTLLLCAGLLPENAHAQAVARVVWTCDGCVESGKLTDADLEGALSMHELGSGTYLMAFDGFAGRSITYVATVVKNLDHPWQPNRELSRGQYLVMKLRTGPHPAPELEKAMFDFYRAAPVGWSKDFVPSEQARQSASDNPSLGHFLLQSTPVPIADLTFPDSSVNVYSATMGGVTQNAVLSWANNSMTGRVAVAQQNLLGIAANLFGATPYGSEPRITITVNFTDRSKMVLVADTSSTAGKFVPSKDYGDARDSSGNTVPYNISQIGGANVGEAALYSFSNSQKDYDDWAARLALWGVGAPGRSANIACTGIPDGRGGYAIHCMNY